MAKKEAEQLGLDGFEPPAPKDPNDESEFVMNLTHADIVACLERECAMRQSVYPRLVESRRMKKESALRELAAMSVALQIVKKSVYP